VHQPHLDRVTKWATGPDRQAELLAARADYFARTGEVREDERSFEARMATFLEWYLFDRPLTGGTTPVAAFLQAHAAELSEAERAIHRGLLRTLRAVFEVRKMTDGSGLDIVEPLSGTRYEVYERRGLVGIQKGDLIDARIVPFEGRLLFSGAFLYHPREARKAVLAEARRRRKVDPAASPEQFAFELAGKALKLERYRNIAVRHIYAFGPNAPKV
jgi:hypothetical protein